MPGAKSPLVENHWLPTDLVQPSPCHWTAWTLGWFESVQWPCCDRDLGQQAQGSHEAAHLAMSLLEWSSSVQLLSELLLVLSKP